LVGRFSKPIKLNWDFKSPTDAVLYEGRSADTFDETVKLVHKPNEYASKLRSVGVERTAVIKQVKTVFGSLELNRCEKMQHINKYQRAF
jgi:hypothetical protein